MGWWIFWICLILYLALVVYKWDYVKAGIKDRYEAAKRKFKK